MFLPVQFLPIGLTALVIVATTTWLISSQLGDVMVALARVEERQAFNTEQGEQFTKQLTELKQQGEQRTKQLEKLEALLKK